MGNTQQSSSLSHEYKLRDNNHNTFFLVEGIPLCLLYQKKQKIVSGFSQTQQHILFIFIPTSCFGQLTINKPPLQNLQSGACSTNSTLHYCQVTCWMTMELGSFCGNERPWYEVPIQCRQKQVSKLVKQ
jgi:hypothetical protein